MDRTLIEVVDGSNGAGHAGGVTNADATNNASAGNTSSATHATNTISNTAKSTSPLSHTTILSFDSSEEESPSFRKQSSSLGTSTHTISTNTTTPSQQDGISTSLRPLSDFLFEDPTVYSSEEIKEVLDMIHDGNCEESWEGGSGGANAAGGGNASNGAAGGNHANAAAGGNPGGAAGNLAEPQKGGLKPICKAYGILGFIRFLDCYYLTLITKRAKCGDIGGNSIYTVKVSEENQFLLV